MDHASGAFRRGRSHSGGYEAGPGDTHEDHAESGDAYVFETPARVWIDVSGASGKDAYFDPTQTRKASVGAPAIQLAMAYARNTGRTFIPDPKGSTEMARFRRWPHLLSSAIRSGSTSHLEGKKAVGRWTGGKDSALDVGLLAMHEAALVSRYIPEIKDFRLSGDMSRIVDDTGAEVSRKAIDDLVSRARDAGAPGIGETTLRRAVVTRTAAAESEADIYGEIRRGEGGEFGVFQRAVEDLVLDSGSTGSGVVDGHPLKEIAYAEGRSPGPLVANLPRAVRNSGGVWTLHDRTTGREIGRVATTDEAIRLASEHAGLDQKDAASMAFLETMFQGADLSGQLHDTLGLNAGTEADISTVVESDAATHASAELKARVEAQERMRGGDGSFARLIFGSSTTEIIGNARRVINRILGGGSILTVFHEEGYSLRKAARAAGILTREDDIRMLRAADRILAGKTERRGGGRLSFLPENFDSLSEAEQDVAIDEGISELLEAEILRTRKGGGARQLPPGLVSRNLSAFSQLAGDRTAGRYRAFIGAFRQFFGLQMSRAMEIQRALENGTLDRKAYEGYLRKLYGDVTSDSQQNDVAESTGAGPTSNGDSMSKTALEGGPLLNPSYPDGNSPAGIGGSPPNPPGNPFRNPDGTLPTTPYHRSAGDADLAEKEAKFNSILAGPISQADAAYNAVPETHGGKVLGTDLAREVLPEYRTTNGRTRYTGITTSTASQYGKDRLWREIHDRSGRESLLFTAGGPASGKSTVVNHKLIEEHELIYDGTMRDLQWAKNNLEAATAQGWDSTIVWVGRPLKLAAIGAVERSISEGRPFALTDLPDAHYTAQRTVVELAKYFKDDPAMDFQLYFNEGASRDIPAIKVTFEEIDSGGKYSYDESNETITGGTEKSTQRSDGKSGLERFRTRLRQDIIGVFQDAVAGKITAGGRPASHEILLQLAGKDEELQRILKESGK